MTVEQEQVRILQILLPQVDKRANRDTVNHTMVSRNADVHYVRFDDVAILIESWQHVDFANSCDGDLRSHDDRMGDGAANDA